MQIRSTDLQCNRSPYILAITTLFAVTSLFQLNSILRTSSDNHPHPLQPVSSSITTVDTIDLNGTKKKQMDRFLRRNEDPYGNKADTNDALRISVHPDDYAPVVVDKGFAMNHLNASENISTTVPTNVMEKWKSLARATATGESQNHIRTSIAYLKNYKALPENITRCTDDLAISATQ